MGSVCCCFQVDYLEDHLNRNGSVYRNCICLQCFIQNFLNLYTSLFQRGEMHAIPSSIQGAAAMTSTASVDSSLSDMYRSPPRPLPYDADPRCFRLVSRHEKGSSHLGETETEPLRGENDIDSDSEALGGETGTKWTKSVSEDPSKEEYSKGSLRISQSKAVPGIENIYWELEDEDVCPTCLEEYGPENPKIVTKCSHHFHLGCIYEWMERSESCPVCGKVMAFDESP